MQEINLNFQKFSAISVLFAKQGEVGRKFKAVITDDTEGYTIPADAVFSVWFSGASGAGNYTMIGDRSAFAVDGNTVTVELITQMLNNKGSGKLCLCMANDDGTRLGTWNIPYEVEEVPGMGSVPAKQQYSAWTVRKLRDINTGKLTEEEKSTFASLDGADFLGSDFFVASNNLPGFASWAYANAGIDIPYLKSVHNTFRMMFDWYNKAENGYKRKLLDETEENKNYLAMLLPGSYTGGATMESHGYFYTLTGDDYKIGDIFCMRYATYLDGVYADSCYYMALCIAENKFLLYQDFGAWEDATYKSNTQIIDYAGLADIINNTTEIYFYVLRPENIAIADVISLEKKAATSLVYSEQTLTEEQKVQARKNIGVADVANAIKGSASGEAVVVLEDVSPIEHELSVKVDVPNATVTKCGKNIIDADALINAYFTKDENGIYHMGVTHSGAKTWYFPNPIPPNTPIHFKFYDLVGYNANAGALFYITKHFADDTSSGGDWCGFAETFTNEITISRDKAIIAITLYPYNPSADYYCNFSAVQVEIGTTATPYEPYKEPATYTADEKGVVNGIVGSGEAMTLFAESGATVTAEYNKDINKVIESLVQAIISLGGNV